MKISSPVFGNNERIPSKFTCDGENINPELNFENVPENTKSLVLIMDDPDIPNEIKQSRGIEVFDHWVIFNIPKETAKISENSVIGTQGSNSRSESKYTGPCPPPQYEPKEHRYFFKLYVLNSDLDLKEGATKEEVETAMKEHIIENVELVGRYSRE